jgi:hypothetical protein
VSQADSVLNKPAPCLDVNRTVARPQTDRELTRPADTPAVHSSPLSLLLPGTPQPERRRRRTRPLLNVAVGLLSVLAVLVCSGPAAAEFYSGDGGSQLSTPPPATVNNVHVFAVGDCIMLGATPALESAISNIEIDAKVSRQASTGIEILRARGAAGQLPDVVVFHLGTNGPFSQRQFDDLMQILSGVRRVVVLNLRVPRTWEESNNAVISAGAHAYPSTVLVDWHAATANNLDWLWTDGIHLRPAGEQAYAALIASAVR